MLCPCCSGHQLVGDDELYDKAKRQSDHYNRDIAITFLAQLLSFRACFRAEIVHCPAIVSDITCDSGNSRAILFKLKLIKTYLRGSMVQERLNGLAILSIEIANYASPLLCLKGVVRSGCAQSACRYRLVT